MLLCILHVYLPKLPYNMKESADCHRIVSNCSEFVLLRNRFISPDRGLFTENGVGWMKTYQAGIDIGSTTVKLVLLEESSRMVWGEYRRHGAKTQETLADMMRAAREQLGPCEVRVRMTGSGAISLAEALGVGFVQEVVAVAGALQKAAPPDRRAH